jgi:hypothetical protein
MKPLCSKQSSAKDQGPLTYVPPRLRKIELVAEEVLATGCKTEIAPAPNNSNCATCIPSVSFGS